MGMGEMLKFTKTETTERGATKYLAQDGYGVVGRDVTYAGRDGGSVTARRFMAYAGPTELLGEFARKTDAVAACQRHADALARAELVEPAEVITETPVQINVTAVTEAEIEAVVREARTVADFFPDPKNPKRKELVRLAKAAGAVKVDSQIFMPGRVQPIAKSWPDLVERLAWGGSAPEDVARLSIRMARIKRNTASRLPAVTLDLTRVDGDALLEHVRNAVRAPAPQADPATEDDTAELFDRVLRRVRYETLRAFLLVLEQWVAGGKNNHAGSDHSGELEPCWETFHASDIRTMVNDTARELGTAEPHREQ
jgi:hypothetical protein